MIARRAVLTLVILAVVLAPALVVAIRSEQGAASFGDREVVGENRITSARVSIGIGDRTVPFATRVVAPGDTRSGSIELVNDGTVPLHYSIGSVAADAVAAPWIEWRFGWSPDGETCRGATGASALVRSGVDVASGVRIFGDPATGLQSGDRRLAIGERQLLCFDATLSVDAPNSVQGHGFEQRFVVHAEQDELDELDGQDGVD